MSSQGVTKVSPASRAGGSSPGMRVAVAVLVVIAVLAVIAGIMYYAEPAKSLPSILGTITRPASRADAHRSLRGGVSVAFGVVCLVAAWFVGRMARSARR